MLKKHVNETEAGLYKTCKNHVNKQRRSLKKYVNEKLGGGGGYGREGGGGGCE